MSRVAERLPGLFCGTFRLGPTSAGPGAGLGRCLLLNSSLLVGGREIDELGTVDLVFDKEAIRFTSLSDRSEPGKEGETADS